MDDTTLAGLLVALQATPDNQALLGVVLRGYVQRSDTAEGARLLENRTPAQVAPADHVAAARIWLAARAPERALPFVESDVPEAQIVRARALVDLGRRDEARVAYNAAVRTNATLDDPALKDAIERSPDERVPARDLPPSFDFDALMRGAKVTFADVGGLDELKERIRKKVITPRQKPGLFDRFRKKPGGGVLLYGPPGCGKTLIARATAGEIDSTFINVQISDVLDMWMGNSEQKLKGLFDKARERAPSVLFFDEVEALGAKRQYGRAPSMGSVVSQFLAEMDGFSSQNHGVLVLAATNVPWAVDPAFRRPGRFDRVLFVPPPDRVAREAILRIHLADRPVAKDLDVAGIASNTGGFSGADLEHLVETAVDFAIDRSLATGKETPVSQDDLVKARADVKATTSEWLTTARNYAKYANEGGQYDEVLEFLAKRAT